MLIQINDILKLSFGRGNIRLFNSNKFNNFRSDFSGAKVMLFFKSCNNYYNFSFRIIFGKILR